jgi:PIN domain nuclease of toxin-antitoxin system
MTVVFDTSAFLALRLNEPGAERVAAARDVAVMSTVSVAEVVAKLIDRDLAPEQARGSVALLGMTVLPFDAAQAELSGLLRTQTRGRGLSLGDRCCLALALVLKAPVMTADRAWAGLDLGIPVEVIR